MPRIRAPEIPPGCNWLNSRPLRLQEFRGHYVLLDFWTYGCINCIHIIPRIAALAATYLDLKIISIHTGKFDRETDLTSIGQAVERYKIQHPVVIDRDRQIWDNYTVRAYPTFVLIDPQGYVLLTRSGEQGLEPVKQTIQQHLTANATDHPFIESRSETRLRFPGKLLASDKQLFISDSSHHRIVVAQLPHPHEMVSKPPLTIGNSRPGLVDGDFFTAQFRSPQGLTFDAATNCLFIADTGNHVIRKIDLAQQQVSTIAGTGKQSMNIHPHGGPITATPLNSPWDLALINQTLFVAMAGSHQIWQLDLSQRTIATFAGSGAEGCFDGSPDVAAFAQPSGIATDGQSLYIADCESSSIRQIDLATQQTQTICGSGNLYVFGDRDGIGEAAQLQHPMGLTYDHNALWIADTYNHKIKRFDLKTGACRTIASGFAEPSGITFAHNALLIADTNNHCIQCLPLDAITRHTVDFADLCPPGVCLQPLE